MLVRKLEQTDVDMMGLCFLLLFVGLFLTRPWMFETRGGWSSLFFYGAFGVVGNEAFGAFWCCGMQEECATEGLVRAASFLCVNEQSPYHTGLPLFYPNFTLSW